MDKYEYKLKLEQIKNLIESKDYETAAQIADSINWKKVKSVATLCMIGELFERTKRLEESKEILLMAYDRSPVGRNIIYRLAHVAIKLSSLDEAQEYYEEFVEIAPHDNMKYVLKYEIAKAKGASLDELISILEEFKEREYTEEWAFELAYLYHRNGQAEKCVDVCDELILWFGEGRYVEKALELKMMYQPLNKLQEDKYRRYKQKREGVVEVSPYDELSSGEIVRETVKIPSILSDTGRFNTQNLQEELAKSMEQIMAATKQETVSDAMSNIKKIVWESQDAESGYETGPMFLNDQTPEEMMYGTGPISMEDQGPDQIQEAEQVYAPDQVVWPQRASETRRQEWMQQLSPGEAMEPEDTGQEDSGAEENFSEEPIDESVFEPALDIDFKGIMSEEPQEEEPQEPGDSSKPNVHITGKMSLEEILAEWEKTKEAAKTALEKAEQRKLKNAKVKALREAEMLMERLMAEIDLETEEEAASEQREQPESDPAPEINVQTEPEEVPASEPESGEQLESDDTAVTKVQPEYEERIPMEEEVIQDLPNYMTEPIQEAEPEQSEEEVQEMQPNAGIAEPEIAMEPVSDPSPAPETQILEKQEELEKKILKRQQVIQQVLEREVREEQLLQSEVTIESVSQDDMPIMELDEEQKKIFTYFTLISGMEQQICQALEGSRQRKRNISTSIAGNLVITGGKRSGKTVLATDFVKAYQKLVRHTGGKVGKISAEALNQKNINTLVKAVEGGYLMIERAGGMSRDSVDKLSHLMEQDTKGMMVILEDERAGIEKVLARNPEFTKKFTERIHVPIFTSDELVEFAKAYAMEHDCEIEDMGILALYNSISNIQKLDEATTLTEVKEIMDDAISRASRGGLKKLFGGKRNTENGLVLIKEKDFRE